MLPHERQRRIKELIAQQQTMKISALSSLLGVSEMTIHRDVQKLVKEGVVLRTFGGVTHREKASATEDICIVCQRRNHPRLAYRLILADNQIETTCCAHCGLLRHHQLQGKVLQAICFDFLYSTTISASTASYVMESEVDLQCCQPQVLSFERRQEAERFVRGFGGTVLHFAQATAYLQGKMGEGHCRHDA